MSEERHGALSPSERKTINHSIINEQTNEYRSKQRLEKNCKKFLIIPWRLFAANDISSNSGRLPNSRGISPAN